MKKNRILKVAASSMAVASIPALLASCGGDSSSNNNTPTQPPADNNTTTAATPAATAAPAAVVKLSLEVDIVRGSKNIAPADAPTQSCVYVNQFARNEQVVFRVRVVDPVTGKEMDDKALKSVTVQLKNGATVAPLAYGPHPKDPPNASFWTGNWVIPGDAPVGNIDMVITATGNDGRAGTWSPNQFPVGAAIQVIDKVRAVIPVP
jgi:hypothetical protein